jgi:uncharacterized protein YdeI (YjbR/CyaY-like superfamily)
VSPVPAKRFTVELQRVEKTATMFRVPFDLKEAFGRARPPVRVPADLRDALRADDAAWKSFQKLSFSHRREYAEWVEEAKRPETRARRIAATLERAAKGLPQR